MKNIFVITFFIACVALATAIMFPVKACSLCKAQQACYGCVLLFTLAGMLKRRRLAATGLLIGFLTLFAISSYHLLVQTGVFPDPCSHTSISSVNDFLMVLGKSKCSDVTWRILGIPVSAWNLLLSSIALIIGFAELRLRFKPIGLVRID